MELSSSVPCEALGGQTCCPAGLCVVLAVPLCTGTMRLSDVHVVPQGGHGKGSCSTGNSPRAAESGRGLPVPVAVAHTCPARVDRAHGGGGAAREAGMHGTLMSLPAGDSCPADIYAVGFEEMVELSAGNIVNARWAAGISQQALGCPAHTDRLPGCSSPCSRGAEGWLWLRFL